MTPPTSFTPDRGEIPKRAGGPLVIGLAGGSGSGKTTIAEALVADIGAEDVVLIQHDAYYRDNAHLAPEDRAAINYDHPDSLETELLVEHLEALSRGAPIERPVYDFTHHTRREETVTVEPKPVIVVEGILVLVEPELRAQMDLKVFIDTDPDLRVLRRIERDVQERGRTIESVATQYRSTVRPMHLQFVEPSKRYADVIIPEGYNIGAVSTLIAMTREFLRRR